MVPLKVAALLVCVGTLAAPRGVQSVDNAAALAAAVRDGAEGATVEIAAGGGFKHAGHQALDRKKNYPLSNLYVSILQRLGIQTDRFSSGTGTMQGLELA